MLAKRLVKTIFPVLFFTILLSTPAWADPAFDFGLPLFGQEEIRFEKSKVPDFNFQLLKKYLNEHQGSPLQQLHAISRWFNLIKLSDTPRRAELIKFSSGFFSTSDRKEIGVEDRLREVFFNGLLLAFVNEDSDNSDDERFEEILLACEPILGENPDYFIAKGLIFHYLRHRPNNYFAPMKPEEDLKRALVLIPKTAQYYYVMGQAFRMLGTQESSLFLAIASYEKSASLEPRNPKLQNSLLSIYMGLHEDFQARGKSEPFWLEEAVYKKILTMSPSNPYALNNLGYLYAEYGVNPGMAQELCQKAVDISPDNAGFRDSLGWAAFKNRDYKKAEEELKKSLSMRASVYEPNYHLATLYYATGELNKAEEYYRHALKIKPESAESLNNLAYLLAEQNRKIDEATAMAELAVKLEPNNASYLDTLGWLAYRAGDKERALTLLLKSAQLAPGQGEILMHIGVVYLEKGEFSLALDYLRQAQKADPNLKETENALYLALRLKNYFNSLIEYHGMYGEKADMDRICHILTAISRLYQEEKQYDKAIEYTRLCAEVRNGNLSLAKPIFSFYSLPETAAKKADAEPAMPVTTVEGEGESEAEAQSNDEAGKKENEELETIPESSGFPLVLRFGPQTFALAGRLVPTLGQIEGLSFTLFIRNILKPARGLIIRCESESTQGSVLLQLAADYFRQLDAKIEETEHPDVLHISFPLRQVYAIADRNSLYVFPDELPEFSTIETMNRLCPHIDGSLGTIQLDWPELQKQIPVFLRPLVKNPMAPFIRSVTRYSYKNGNLSEFSILTTGKEENNNFLKNFARRLFAFKMQGKALGIETTIKVRGEKELVYLSIEFTQVNSFVKQRLGPWSLKLMDLLLNTYLGRFRCFVGRMFYDGKATDLCPNGGKIEFNGESGLVECTLHDNNPAIPLFLDEACACRFYRNRLERIIEANPDKNWQENESLLIETGKEYNIPGCPTSGSWQVDENGKVKCSNHEN